MNAFRLYKPDEVGRDGYPPIWHERLKHEVRAEAGNRCVRCKHPYRNGEHGNGEWSPCDEYCNHAGPLRVWLPEVDAWAEPDERIGPCHYRNHVAQARWRILTVHHLDGNKANCRWWNLVSLCQRCHLQIQNKVQMPRVWPWEHSGWFRPYVAGFYAWTYLREDLTRAQAEDRLEELLALERAA